MPEANAPFEVPEKLAEEIFKGSPMKTCEDCQFWKLDEKVLTSPRTGVCVFNPPAMLVLPAGTNIAGQSRVQVQSQCPPTLADFWCGRFKAAVDSMVAEGAE